MISNCAFHSPRFTSFISVSWLSRINYNVYDGLWDGGFYGIGLNRLWAGTCDCIGFDHIFTRNKFVPVCPLLASLSTTFGVTENFLSTSYTWLSAMFSPHFPIYLRTSVIFVTPLIDVSVPLRNVIIMISWFADYVSSFHRTSYMIPACHCRLLHWFTYIDHRPYRPCFMITVIIDSDCLRRLLSSSVHPFLQVLSPILINLSFLSPLIINHYSTRSTYAIIFHESMFLT